MSIVTSLDITRQGNPGYDQSTPSRSSSLMAAPTRVPRIIMPLLVLEVHGVAYVIAHCHRSDAERTFRLDRIRACLLY